jgi:hypothetical protein
MNNYCVVVIGSILFTINLHAMTNATAEHHPDYFAQARAHFTTLIALKDIPALIALLSTQDSLNRNLGVAELMLLVEAIASSTIKNPNKTLLDLTTIRLNEERLALGTCYS